MDFYLYMGLEPSKPPSERLGRHKGELGERQGMDAIHGDGLPNAFLAPLIRLSCS